MLFLIFRLLDPDIPQEFVSEILGNLRRAGMFPFSAENRASGAKYKLLYRALNGPVRFAIFRKLLGVKLIYSVATFFSGAKNLKVRSRS